MTVFECSACGSHAFALSENLQAAQCGDCGKPLGSWRDLRQRLCTTLTAPPLAPAHAQSDTTGSHEG